MGFIKTVKDLPGSSAPKRIISIVPSQTELLYDLGLEEQVAGITKFCIHPENWFRNKTRVGGTKQLNLDLIRELRPDLVIANKEENVKQQVEALAEDFPVYVSDVNNLQEALEMIETIGGLTQREEKAHALAEKIRQAFQQLQPATTLLKACYLIWKDPYMTVGGDTFISNMMPYAGFENIFSTYIRYPETDLATIRNSGCEVVLLSSEPYPFKEKHAEEIRKEFPGITVILANGEYFSWYGSRLLTAPEYFKTLRQHSPIS